MAGGIPVPWPGIQPMPPALEAESPNHWTPREILNLKVLKYTFKENEKGNVFATLLELVWQPSW